MIHGIEEREQLERLHDRHKRFSLDVFDQISSNADDDAIEAAKKKLAQAVKELDALKEKLHSK